MALFPGNRQGTLQLKKEIGNVIMVSRRNLLGTAASLFTVSSACAQQEWPDRPVRVVVPYPPGGSNDIVARLLSEMLRVRTGQPWVVENRSGGGGNVGAELVAKSAPEESVLLLTAPGPLTINNALFPSMPFDAARDFAPLALVASVPMVLMVGPKVPAHSVRELIALAKSKPGQLSFGSSGNGSTNHLAGELFRQMAGLDMVHVPYRGAAPAMTDLVAGQIQVLFDNLPAVLPQVRDGQVSALAVAGTHQVAALPGVPTVGEAGLPGFAAEAWFGLAGPAAMSQSLQSRVIELTRTVLADEGFRAKLALVGADPGTLFGAEFRTFLDRERETWGKIIAASGARAD